MIRRAGYTPSPTTHPGGHPRARDFKRLEDRGGGAERARCYISSVRFDLLRERGSGSYQWRFPVATIAQIKAKSNALLETAKPSRGTAPL
jgi:hypothetical protein